MKISTGGGRRRGTGKDPTPPPNQGLLNRANTMVYNPSNTGYGGFSYTSNSVNSGARPQFYLNQIPYVQPPSQTEYVEWFSRYMLLIQGACQKNFGIFFNSTNPVCSPVQIISNDISKKKKVVNTSFPSKLNEWRLNLN